MKLPKSLTTVTPFSKYLALSLFILLPIGCFFLGMKYQKEITSESMQIQSTHNTPILSPTPNPTTVSCTKILSKTNNWDSYSCDLYSLQLPSGWSYQNNQNVVEFINYDISTAQGRSYDPNVDKGKMKFVIEIFKTTQNLSAFVIQEALSNNDTIESLSPQIIHTYSSMKVALFDPNHPSAPIMNTYIQNPSKTEVVVFSPEFGIENNVSLYNQIISTFQFLSQ